jgi:hypothetical protein
MVLGSHRLASPSDGRDMCFLVQGAWTELVDGGQSLEGVQRLGLLTKE